jgi:hypothetical protein
MRKTAFLFLFLLPLGLFPALIAQRLDHFDLLLFTLLKNTDGAWTANAPRFLTGDNPRGYNNQPQFFSNSELYLTAQFPSDTSQTDIVSMDLIRQAQQRVILTPGLSEYSPTLMPDGKHFSAVRVEADGAQRLWMFPLDRSNAGRPVFTDLADIWYHCWLNATDVAVFRVGEPHLLELANTNNKITRRIASNIGRCLLKTPTGKLAFVQKATEQTWFIKEYDPAKQSSEIIVKTLAGSEDFALMPGGTYVAGSGAKLYFYEPGKSADWRLMADLSKYGVRTVTRLALSPDGKQLVVVVQY